LSFKGSFGGIERFFKEYRKIDPNVKRETVVNFLNNKRTYTLHKAQRKRFPRRFYLVARPGHTFTADVCYLLDFESENQGYKYLLVIVDLFSKYLSVYPLKTLKSSEMIASFTAFFENNIYIYSKAMTDLGVELTSSAMQKLYTKYKIVNYHSESREIKAGLVEITIRNIRRRLYQYFTEYKTNVYLDVLPKIVDTYNLSEHRGLLQKCPLDIHLIGTHEEACTFAQKIYKYRRSLMKHISPALALGKYVRIVSIGTTQNNFFRGYKIRNTLEKFQISKVNKHHIPVTYNLIDDSNEPVKGIFYRSELILTEKDEICRIHILKTKKEKGKTKYLVSYIDYPESKHIWITSDMLVQET
jgi:hypothetical protein